MEIRFLLPSYLYEKHLLSRDTYFVVSPQSAETRRKFISPPCSISIIGQSLSYTLNSEMMCARISNYQLAHLFSVSLDSFTENCGAVAFLYPRFDQSFGESLKQDFLLTAEYFIYYFFRKGLFVGSDRCVAGEGATSNLILENGIDYIFGAEIHNPNYGLNHKIQLFYKDLASFHYPDWLPLFAQTGVWNRDYE